MPTSVTQHRNYYVIMYLRSYASMRWRNSRQVHLVSLVRSRDQTWQRTFLSTLDAILITYQIQVEVLHRLLTTVTTIIAQ